MVMPFVAVPGSRMVPTIGPSSGSATALHSSHLIKSTLIEERFVAAAEGSQVATGAVPGASMSSRRSNLESTASSIKGSELVAQMPRHHRQHEKRQQHQYGENLGKHLVGSGGKRRPLQGRLDLLFHRSRLMFSFHTYLPSGAGTSG
jgi:hypothetical protein